MKIDDYLFEPCGYSMNGILRNESNDYGLVRTRMNHDTGCYVIKWSFFCTGCAKMVIFEIILLTELSVKKQCRKKIKKYHFMA